MYGNHSRDMKSSLVRSTKIVWKEEPVEGGVGICQAIRGSRALQLELRSHIPQAELEVTCRVHCRWCRGVAGHGGDRAYPDRRNDVDEPCTRHVQQEQVLGAATDGGEEVESMAEVDAKGAIGTGLGSARPAVSRRKVLNERRYRADETAGVAGAVARRMWTLQDVLLTGMVHEPCVVTAIGHVWTRAADDGVHHALQGVAPLVAAGHGDTTQVTLAGILELLGA